VDALPAEHGGERGGVGGADGGHDLQEEVVAVAASGDGWLGESAVQFGAAGRGEEVDDAVGLDRLRLALGVGWLGRQQGQYRVVLGMRLTLSLGKDPASVLALPLCKG
jgi:hypothetical protein